MSTTLTRNPVMDADEQASPDLTLSCPADAENVAVIRRAVTGVARAVGADEGLVNDVRTVVTEACGNAAVHAYPSGLAGAVIVTCTYDHPWLRFGIRDFGSGIQPQVDEEEAPRLRIGLSLMSVLADRFEIQSESGQGTEVLLGFDTQRSRDVNGGDERIRAAEPTDEGVELVATGPLGAEGIAPALVMLGVRSGFDVERLSELQGVGTTLADAVRDGQIARLELRSPSLGNSSVQVEVDPGTASEASLLAEGLADGIGELIERDGETLLRIELPRAG